MKPGRAWTSSLAVPPLLLARWVGWVARVHPTDWVRFVVSCPSSALRARVCAVSTTTWRLFTGVRAWCVLCVRCAVSWASGLLFTGVLAQCVVLCVRCGWPLGSCSLCLPCTVSSATCFLLAGALLRCVVLRVQCPGPLVPCSPLCPLGALCCVCSVLGHLASVDRCARSVRCAACALSWATWLLFTGVHARRVVLRVRRPGPLASCSRVRSLGAWCCLCGVLRHLAPVHHYARSVRCVACALSWATWLLFSGVLARCFALRVWCPGPLGFCSPLCTLSPLCCVCGDPVNDEYRASQGEAKRCDRSRRLWCCWTVPPFNAISERREDWKYQEYYRCPGPQQSSTGDMDIPLTLQCELIPTGGTDPDPASAAELQ